jgi:hypothetical protein
MGRASVSVISPEIARASLHIAIPWYTHLYTLPFLSLYPLLAYAYYVKYDQWLVSEEWTFLACVSLGATHALSFLITKWSAGARAWITTMKVGFPNVLTHRLCHLKWFRHIPSRKPTAYVLSLNNIEDKGTSSNLIKSTWLIRTRTPSTTNVILTP